MSTLFDVAQEDARLCQYGKGDDDYPVCARPATHGARWRHGERIGGLDCCRTHADYYATAWVPMHLRHGWDDHGVVRDEAAWIEVLA